MPHILIMENNPPEIPSMTGFPELSKAPALDLAGDLGRMAREVSAMLAAPVVLDLSPSVDATKAGPEPDAKPSFHR